MRISSFVILLTSVIWCGCVSVSDTGPREPRPHVVGRISGNTYTSPQGGFSVPVPVASDFGGRVLRDDAQSVTFHDDRGSRISFYSKEFSAQSSMMSVMQKEGREKALGILAKDIYGETIVPHYHPEVWDGTLSFVFLKPLGTRTGVAIFVHQNRVFMVETDLMPGVQFLSKQDDLSTLDKWLENSAVDLARSMEVK